ncbi:hypothetical protein AAHC03_013558 [Spirometra sp. Aus1]|nr:unnamed protein product [Spirometra erinaceieuropaei]
MPKDVDSPAALEIKINKWDINAAKHALDDAAKEIMKSHYEVKECFRLFDGRLLLCTLAVLVALLAVVYDYVFPYPDSRYILMGCAVTYFLITSVLSWYMYFIEGNIFFNGIQADKTGLDPADKWTLSSSIKKHNPNYKLSVEFYDGKSKTRNSVDATRTIDNFFDIKGNLCIEPFKEFLLELSRQASQVKKNQ